jgi:RNA polymerase sigma-70 factor (ECF subfamily)
MDTENCLDSKLLSVRREIVTTDQRVTELFEAMRESVYRYLVMVFGNPSEAEEITQEAFLRLLRHLQSGRVVDHVRPWIFRVAHNLAVDMQKGRKFESSLDAESWEECYQAREDPEPNPEMRVLQQESFRQLETLLSQLSSQQRQCLILRAQGFRYEEIAKILRITSANVAQSLRRGLKKVADLNHE